MKHTSIAAGLALPSALLLASPLHAENAEDETWVRLAAYFPDIDTKVSIGRPGEENLTTLIDFESDLDLTDRDVLPDLLVGTRLGGNWRIEGEAYTLSRSSETSLAREIVFDGVTYPVAANVSSRFGSDIYRLAIGYSFVRTDKAEVGASLGAHITSFGVEIEGQASVGGAVAQTEVRRREVLAPLPTLGLYGNAEVAPGLNLQARADYLSLSIDDYDGRLLNLEVGASYKVAQWLRLGAIYRRVDYRLDINKNAYTGRIEYDFDGPAVFAEVVF